MCSFVGEYIVFICRWDTMFTHSQVTNMDSRNAYCGIMCILRVCMEYIRFTCAYQAIVVIVLSRTQKIGLRLLRWTSHAMETRLLSTLVLFLNLRSSSSHMSIWKRFTLTITSPTHQNSIYHLLFLVIADVDLFAGCNIAANHTINNGLIVQPISQQ